MQWHTPIGYRVEMGGIVVDEEKAKLVQWIFAQYDAGTSAWKIANVLKEQRAENANGKVSWTHVSIGRILENHNYLVTEYYSQIIESELFERIQKKREAVRKELGREKYRKSHRSGSIFYGKLVCAACGEQYRHYQPHNRGRGKGTAQWKCKNYLKNNRLFCAGGYITDEEIKKVLVQAINELIDKPYQFARKESQKTEYAKVLTAEERKLGQLIREASKEENTEELTKLLFQKASIAYQKLEINDREMLTEQMEQILAGRNYLTEFDEELFVQIIKQIQVDKTGTANVVFLNGYSVRIKYQ
ncbi:MAG: recombinase family protein [Lachnospiraceae bacterium]|nr:recombinase family protein [Lachnospiraceae bacterium]